MNRYRKGADFERELVSLFWAHGWTAIRAAGSGTVSHPVPDVIAVKDEKIVVIECKSTKNDRLSLKKAIISLNEFAIRSGGKVYIGIKFARQAPRFYDIVLLLTKKNYTINLKDNFLSFEFLIGEQERLL